MTPVDDQPSNSKAQKSEQKLQPNWRPPSQPKKPSSWGNKKTENPQGQFGKKFGNRVGKEETSGQSQQQKHSGNSGQPTQPPQPAQPGESSTKKAGKSNGQRKFVNSKIPSEDTLATAKARKFRYSCKLEIFLRS